MSKLFRLAVVCVAMAGAGSGGATAQNGGVTSAPNNDAALRSSIQQSMQLRSLQQRLRSEDSFRRAESSAERARHEARRARERALNR